MARVPMSISDLQAKWPKLLDVDRALAVHAIHKTGKSFRELARELNCSASLLRHLDQAAQAPIIDLLLARKVNGSTRALVRGAKASRLQRVADAREELEDKRAKEAAAGCSLICEWLEEEGLEKGHGEAIILESRRMLAISERTKKLPKSPAPPDISVAEIIHRSRPPQAVIEESSSAAFYGAWLARWTWYAFLDPNVRDQALHLALAAQPKRPNVFHRHPLALPPEDRRTH